MFPAQQVRSLAHLARAQWQLGVVCVEGRGNGRADCPPDDEAYGDREYVGDPVAVLDALGMTRRSSWGCPSGAGTPLQMAAWHPGRVWGVVAIGAAFPWPLPPGFDEPADSYNGWGKANRHYWLADYPGWVEFFMSQVFPEPYSTKQCEDGLSWGLQTDAQTLLHTTPAVAEPAGKMSRRPAARSAAPC